MLFTYCAVYLLCCLLVALLNYGHDFAVVLKGVCSPNEKSANCVVISTTVDYLCALLALRARVTHTLPVLTAP